MNTRILKSKKFIAAVSAALSSVLSFLVARFGLDMDVGETVAMASTVAAPFLMYIGAEGYSERDAKTEIATAKIKTEIAEQVLNQIANMKVEGGDSSDTQE